MRISNRQMFTTYSNQMNNSLSALMESNNQSGSGKKINRPSDDPAGIARVMMYRESLGNIERNKANISEATGGLNLADHALTGGSDIITKIKTLNLQSSNETQNGDNREQNATQLRELFNELLSWSNEKYNGQHIFTGHKVDQSAYVMGVGVSCQDTAVTDAVNFVAEGDAAASTLIQFIEDGDPSSSPAFVYSKDGGKTWSMGSAGNWDTDNNGNYRLNAGGTFITLVPKDPANPVLPQFTAVTPKTSPPVEPADYAAEKESSGGTWLTARPTAVYKGDDHDIQTTQVYGTTFTNPVASEGSFARDISVRINQPTPPGSTEMQYSYSLDNGSTWVNATAPAGATQLAIPGGYLKIDPVGREAFTPGQEFLVHPRRADINFEISSNQTITVNMVGKDIFGGLYHDPFTDYPGVVSGPNLFETVGKLIGYCETNDSDGIARCLEELEDCQKYVGTRLAEVGGRENRLTVAFETASIRELSETGAMSAIEDVDTVTLMTKLAQQQLAYNTVLKSSSMIMQMSLMNFI